MPEYTYHCEHCNIKFSLVSSIAKYKDTTKCEICGKVSHRSYEDDLITLNATVKKADSELKTIGDLALRNTERMSEDQKQHLYQKHNAYKDVPSQKELPKGMSRIKKPPKPKWPS